MIRVYKCEISYLYNIFMKFFDSKKFERFRIFQRRERRERDRSKIGRNEDDGRRGVAQAEAREMSQPTN